MPKQLPPFKVSLLYAIFGAFWIVLSDKLLMFIFPDDTVLFGHIEQVKDLLFVAVTSTLLYLLLKRGYKATIDIVQESNSTLRASESRFRTIIEASPIPMALNDAQGNITYLNQAFIQIVGYTLNDIPTLEDWWPLAYPDPHYQQWVAENWQKRLVAAISGNSPFVPMEVNITCKNGIVRTFLVSAFDLKNNFSGIHVVNFYDITERKQSEQALRASESRWKFAIEGSGGGLWDWNITNGTAFYSKFWKEMIGYSEDEIGNKLEEFEKRVHPEDMPATRAALQECLNGKTPVYISEYRFQCKDGNYLWMFDRGIVVERDQNGKPLRMIGIHIDITERKMAERRLTDSESKLATILENVSAYIYLKDTEGHYTFVNRACLELWDLTLEETVGLTDDDLFDSQMAATIREHDRHVLMKAEIVSYEETGIVLNTGKTAHYWSVKIPLRDERDNIYALCGISTDITQSKKADEEIRSVKAKLEAALASMNDAVFISDTEGRFIEFNEAFATFHRFKNKEDCPKTLAEYPNFIDVYSSSGEFLPLEQRGVPRALGGEIGTGIEFTLKRRDTGETWIGSYSYAPIRNNDGVIVGSVVTARDITEQKQKETMLVASEERYRSLYENMPMGLAYCKMLYEQGNAQDFVYLEVNSAFEKLTGLKNVVGKKVSEVIPGICHSDQELFRHYGRVALTGESEHFEYFLGVLKQWYSVSVYCPKKDHFVAIFDIITERKKIEEALIASEKELRLLAESMPQIVWITNIEGESIYLNQRWVDYTGLTLEESYGHNWYNSIHPDDQQRAWEAWQHALNNKTIYSLECRICRNDGVYRWWLDRGVPVFNEHGNIYKWFGTCTDIHDIKKTESVLREKQQLLADSQAIAHVGSWVVDISAGTVNWSEEGLRLYDLSVTNNSLGFDEFLELLHPDDVPQMQDWAKECLAGKQQTGLEFRTRPIDGKYRWLLGNGILETDSDGKALRMIGTVQDITERKKAEETIYDLAYYDPLTHLPNRRLMLDRLKQTLISRTHKSQHGAILFINLNNFRTLNDSKGHAVGDLLLLAITRDLQTAVHEDDTVARIGADEFVLLLDALDATTDLAAAQAESVAQRVLNTINQPVDLQGYEYHCSASIGIALFRAHDIGVDELVKQADMAMHEAKKKGCNTISFFDSTVQTALEFRVHLETGMHKAFNDQYRLYYQVQVDAEGNATGAETLIRWHHPDHGIISPANFIPLAEETGLILPIGKWVLETACTQLKLWEENENTQYLILAVNVSAKQFAQSDFVGQVLDVLKQSGATPHRLKLELTESMLVHNLEDIIAKMNELSSIGVKFSLDDFGTGYSSLAYLKRLPLNQLKIDQSFVRDALNDPSDAAIIRTIIALGESLGMDVIAEGVETEEQRSFLAAQGCNHYQGYLFSKPLPLAEFEQLLRKLDLTGL